MYISHAIYRSAQNNLLAPSHLYITKLPTSSGPTMKHTLPSSSPPVNISRRRSSRSSGEPHQPTSNGFQ